MLLDRYPLPPLLRLVAVPLCAFASFLLHTNEVWIARRLGVRVRLWHLPRLLRRPQARFKQRVFQLIRSLARPEAHVTSSTLAPNAIAEERTLAGTAAYVHGFKQRAQQHHCIGYGLFRVDVDQLAALRRLYSRRVRPITNLPVFVKAAALAVKKYPRANSILFHRWLFGYRIVRFAHVDVNVPITREVDGETLTFLATIRRADEKTLAQIQDELAVLLQDPADQVPAIQRIKKLHRAPAFLTRCIHFLLKRSPRFYVKTAGTCGLIVNNGSWGEHFFPIGPTTACFSVGGLRPEPVVEGGRVVVRRLAHVCLGVDHYVVSGEVGLGLGHEFQRILSSDELFRTELGPSALEEAGRSPRRPTSAGRDDAIEGAPSTEAAAAPTAPTTP